MSNAAEAARTPPGWYPDPAGTPQSRWWDGDQWTDHIHDPRIQPYSAAATTLAAPEGTAPYTPIIWILTFLPLLSSIMFSTFDWSSYFSARINSSLTTTVAPPTLFTPQYLALVAGGWVIYGVAVLLSYFDRRTLLNRGVPAPFHWAWAFLFYGVYVIGRSVVVRRRTGKGIAPMWVFLAVYIAVTIEIVVVAISATLSAVSQIPLGG